MKRRTFTNLARGPIHGYHNGQDEKTQADAKGSGRKQSPAVADRATEQEGRRRVGHEGEETGGVKERYGGGRDRQLESLIGGTRCGTRRGSGEANGRGGKGVLMRGGGVYAQRSDERDAGRGGRKKAAGRGRNGGEGAESAGVGRNGMPGGEESKGASRGRNGGVNAERGGVGRNGMPGGQESKRAGRGRNGGEGAERGGVGRNGMPDGQKSKGPSRGVAEMGGRKGGYDVDGKGQRRDCSTVREERNGERSNSERNGVHPKGQRLGFKKLQELSEKEPCVVAITLSAIPALKDLLSETEMRQDLIELLCLVLSKAFKSQTDRGSWQYLASTLKDSGFLRTVLPHYVMDMGSESNPHRRAKYPQHLENILAILSEVLSIFPGSSVKTVSLLLTLLTVSVNSLSTLGVCVQPQVVKALEDLQALVLHLQERSRQGTLPSHKDTYCLLSIGGDNPGEEGQQDFRTIPIYPTVEEFHEGHRPYLKPNLTTQCYTDTHSYLDTQFRLLREDFVRPLRDGIQQLLWKQKETERTGESLKAKRFDDVLVYFDTKVLELHCTPTGLSNIVQFDIHPLKFVRWQNSKRLIYGSLVCLSCDNFETLLYATVSDRDSKDLCKGRVQITFTQESRLKLAGIQSHQLFVMVESTAYFEAYRYVLEGLQVQEEVSLPFQRYIVDCCKDVKPPAYLKANDMYDLSSIAEPKYKDSMLHFHSLKENAWPSMEKLGLDESQKKALQLALTKELTIIQGPPGTGKTHVGLKIAHAILTNKNLWRDQYGSATILVVCYTNHALDQFLEGIHKFLKNGIVRVGGRSNSEILKPFNLREITHSRSYRNGMPSHLHFAKKEILNQLNEEEKKLQSEKMKLDCSLKGILHGDVLRAFMSNRHWNSLHQPRTQDVFKTPSQKPSQIMVWLGLGSTIFLQRETETDSSYEAMHEALEQEEEDLIEIAEEADLIQAERIIEDNIGPRGGRDRTKKANMEWAVREMENMMLAMNLDTTDIQAEQSEEGWEMQQEQKKKLKNTIKKELQKSTSMAEEEADKISDVWTLILPDRWMLYRLWVARYRLELSSRALESELAYQNAVQRLADLKQHENVFFLKKATVIGMTTTGAAKYRAVLQEVGPRLVIVEEAAQVLEAHTITTLSQACQHLILIGDHQQLQPSATVYDLAKNFNLEISMFERLVRMGLPFVRLNYQHRMRPEIASLLIPHIYPKLENHPSVMNYESIKGLTTNVFFVDHNQPEESKDGKSRQNQHEAKFVVALCRYLLLQDYAPQQITILTTYTSQLHCLRDLMPAKQFSGVGVHVVDKYQGEENDIVLLSLVRSNTQGKCGFLSIPNRVCVALSRAKKGLYIVGSRETLGQVKLWRNIFSTLTANDQIDKALTLRCQNHPDRKVKAALPEDFKQAPEGGCTQPCEFRLGCGHVCRSVCHPYDPKHKKYNCRQPCPKLLCDQGHKCPLLCYRECPKPCPVEVEKIIPQCQHPQMVPCHQTAETFECKEPCQKTLACGHPCKSTCGGPCTTMCTAKVTLMLKCGHSQQDACYYQTQTAEPECTTPCKHPLKCGHTCGGSCARCYQGRFHVPCFHQDQRVVICSHNCWEACFRDASPCPRPCGNRCIHSKCMKPCWQPCTPCTEPCAWQCPHQRCSKLCHEPCDRPPCNQPCRYTRGCGHPCIGLCGEKCPSKCRICNHKDVTKVFFGTEADPGAYFIQLEDCGHIFEYTAMDRYMGLDDSERANEEEEVAIKLKECPKCQTPIRKSLRYGSRINHSLAEIEQVKLKINRDPAHVEKQRRILQREWRGKTDIHKMLLDAYKDTSDRFSQRSLTANDLWVLENQMDFLARVSKLLGFKSNNMSTKQSARFARNVTEFVCWLSDHHQKFTEQQLFDLRRQLKRLTLLTDLNMRCHEASKRGQSDHIQSTVLAIRNVLEVSGPFTEQGEQTVEESMEKLNTKLPYTGLGVREEERQMITSAMKTPTGRWFKCPEGHVYCSESGESRRCPNCIPAINGGNHRLENGNQGASAMEWSASCSETN